MTNQPESPEAQTIRQAREIASYGAADGLVSVGSSCGSGRPFMASESGNRTTPPGSLLSPLSDEQIREAAVLLAASDAVRNDNIVPAQRALDFSQRWFNAVDTEPIWADGKHNGDCTKAAGPCLRCHRDDYEDRIRAIEAGDE